jgi:DNA-binding transcriptional regulator GbsR (MarR family)
VARQHVVNYPKSMSGGAESERLERQILAVCDAAGGLVEYWGFKSILGRTWALLAVRQEPLAQARIAEMLGVSRSLVNGAITELAGYGVVRSVGEHRNAPYEAVLDVWPAISSVLRQREWMLLESFRLALEGALDEALLDPGSRYSVVRIRLLLKMISAIQRLLGLVIAVRRPNAVATIKEWVQGANQLLESLRGAE